MEIKVIEKTDTEAKIEIRGESHGFPNMLKDALLRDDRVEVASYNIDHPLESEPVLHLRTTDEDPIDILKSVAENLKADMEETKTSI